MRRGLPVPPSPNCVLGGAVFTNAVMTDASFIGCRMIGANLYDSRGAGFHGCVLQSDSADVSGCSLHSEPLEGIRFDEANLSECDFQKVARPPDRREVCRGRPAWCRPGEVADRRHHQSC